MQNPSLNQKLRHSTVAKFELHIEGRSVAVGEIAPEFIVLEQPQNLPATDAQLCIRVEGEETIRHIRLPQGASLDTATVVIERL